MTSERGQAQIDRFLSEAEEALGREDWQTVAARARTVLALDPSNGDAAFYLQASDRVLGDSPAAAAQVPSADTVRSDAEPTSFANGRYSVTRFLGEGGKKRVYLAHDAQLDRDIAFALIKTEGLDDAARQRITREAQAMGRLGSHPHIVTVYDIGEENGQPYLVLPVLPGGDVEGVIEDAPDHKLPIEQAIKIASETCLGLEFSHAKGIIHRDLKPGNVWLAEDGRAMVGDLGLAVATDRSRLTQAGMMVGTPLYMPPEQAMGGEVTPQSDLYSLGAMLYEMVCGRPPFVGDDFVAIIGQHMNAPPVAPAWHRPDCPPGLEALILRLLEKDATKRPASATEVREVLEAIDLTAPPPMTQPPDAAPAHDPLYRTVFVGREHELRRLQQAFDAAVSGEGGLVMVVGEPGIGKTALCQQLATYTSMRGGRWLVGHCYEEGSMSLPYLAFVEAMRSYVLERDPEDLRSDLGTGAGNVARIVSEVRDRVQVEVPKSDSPEDARWRLLNSVTTFLRNAAAVQPLVIVLEDLHWADRGTLDLLLHVARNLEGSRLLIVGTYRDVEVDRTHPLSATLADLRRVQSFLRVPLRGLTVDEVHRMYKAVRGNDQVPWAMAETVHRQTEGNPLFIQEVLRYLVEEGLVVRQDARYVATGDAANAVPEGLRDVVGRRLGHLDQNTNEVLSVASVIGRDFGLEVLRRVAGQTEEELLAALEQAAERSVIEQLSTPGAVGFRFTHAFFRQVLYEEIFAPRRIRWHQQVAQALEEVYAKRLDEHAAELAEHFSQGTEAADLEKAVEYGEMAARRASSVSAYGEAVRHLEQALRAQEVLNPEDKLSRCTLLIDLAWALTYSGRARKALDEIAPLALAVAEESRSEPPRQRIHEVALVALELFAATAVWATPEAAHWAELALASAAEKSPARVRADIAMARVENARGNWGMRPNDWPHLRAARTRLDSAIEDARALANPELLEMAVDAWLRSVFSPGVAERRQALAQTIKDAYFEPLAQEAPHRGDEFPLFAAYNSFLMIGRRDLADETFDLMTTRLRRRNTPNDEIGLLGVLIQHATIDGNFEKAESLQERMVLRSEELGLQQFAQAAIVGGGSQHRLYLGQEMPFGRPADWSPTGEVHPRDVIRVTKSGSDEDVRTMVDALTTGRAGFASEDDETPIYADVAVMEAAARVKHEGAAELFLARYRNTLFVTSGFQYFIGPLVISRLMGTAATIVGDTEGAKSYFESALRICEGMRLRPEKALSHLGLAELLLDRYPDEHDAAIEHLDFAIAEFRDMKMQPALERALGRRGLLKA